MRVRLRIVSEAVADERRNFLRRMETYRSDMELYCSQQPIEELRIKLLRDAGGNEAVRQMPTGNRRNPADSARSCCSNNFAVRVHLMNATVSYSAAAHNFGTPVTVALEATPHPVAATTMWHAFPKPNGFV